MVRFVPGGPRAGDSPTEDWVFQDVQCEHDWVLVGKKRYAWGLDYECSKCGARTP